MKSMRSSNEEPAPFEAAVLDFLSGREVAGRDGGSITAAAFLGKFTKDLTWAHLDIAGTAYQGGAAKGSTGRPSALLLEFLLRRAGAR